MRYLSKAQQAAWRRRLQQAYERPTYAEARAALGRLRQELRGINLSAVASLDEGLEETLTLHGLGLFPLRGVSLKTTNCLESLNAQLGQLTDKVDHWRTSDQKQRWVASALSFIEPRLRRIKGYRHLPQLRAALQAKSGKAERGEGTRIAEDCIEAAPEFQLRMGLTHGSRIKCCSVGSRQSAKDIGSLCCQLLTPS